MTEPIDIIRQLSDEFVEKHKNDNFAKMLIPLREKLATLDSLTNKRTFLRYIKTNVEHELELHILKEHPFGKPEHPCSTEIYDKQFIFYIDQELSIIDKFEEKEKKNFLQQFDNKAIFTILTSLALVSFYFGTIRGELNAQKDLKSSFTPTLADTVALPKANDANSSIRQKNIKKDTVNIPIGKK
jgi:hypothetical protein